MELQLFMGQVTCLLHLLPQQVRDVLHKRMFMKNPHKVWLATHLAEDILHKCPDTIGPIRSDIYQVHEMW